MHWLVVETGGNQAYIFGTQKQRVSVGASDLIRRSGVQWAREAFAAERARGYDVRDVVVASGKALALVDSRAVGMRIIGTVTTTALREAPGLEVWGIVDDAAVADDLSDVAHGLQRALRLHAAARGQLRPPAIRLATTPFTARCGVSGSPAEGHAFDGSRWGRSARTSWKAAEDGRNHLAGEVLQGSAAVPSLAALAGGVTESGWVAVMHADGNSIGAMFSAIAKIYEGTAYLDALGTLSQGLDQVTQQAFRDAVRRVIEDRDPAPGWLLPLIVGGDDVTTVADGRYAFDLTVAFVDAFARVSAADAGLVGIVDVLRERGASPVQALTASAGLAYIKPHHPFSDGYRLAAELCRSAKTAQMTRPRCGALDVHVLHDSVGSPLASVRRHLAVRPRVGGGPVGGRPEPPLALWAGPIVVPVDDDSPSDPRSSGALKAAVETLVAKRAPISRGAARDIRQALLGGGAQIDRVERRLLGAPQLEGADRAALTSFLIEHLQVDDDATGTRFSRIITALDLIDVTRGSVEGRRRAGVRAGVAGSAGAAIAQR